MHLNSLYICHLVNFICIGVVSVAITWYPVSQVIWHLVFILICITDNGFSAEFSVSEEDDIHSIVKQQPCLIILGQTSYARALIVNEVLGQNILPVENYDEQAVWRGINFAYGEATIISLSLAESYELVDNLSTPHGTNIRVSAEDLEVTAQEAEDEAPFMEIRLHNPLLHDGGLVRVMPTWTSKLTLTNLYQKLARGVVPVVIYGVSHNCLSNEVKNE